MKGLELIKEEIFLVKSMPWIRKFFGHLPEKCFRSYKLAYALYIELDGDVKPIHARLSTEEYQVKIGSRNTFVNYIKKYKPKNFKETLFLLDLYERVFCFNCKPPRNPYPNFEKKMGKFHHPETLCGKAIESILEDSRGCIIWKYQLEHILNIFLDNWEEVISTRKGINAKKTDTFKMLKKYKIDDTLTLEDFIWERMIRCSGVTGPSIHGAYLLYELLKQN